MTRPRSLLSALCAAMMVAGCAEREYGPELSEPVVVLEAIHTPATHGSGLGVSIKGSVVVTSVDTDPEWATVFGCQHGKFIVKGKEVWERARVGDSLVCYYREVFEVKKKDGAVVSRALVDYDFLRAVKP